MAKLLAVIAITAALTGAAHAGPYDTSKLTVDEKNTLTVVISNYTVHCDGNGMWPKIRVFHDQLFSEVDIESAAMAEAKRAVGHDRHRFGPQWCTWATNHLQKWNDNLVAARPPPPPPPEPKPPPPVDLADTAEGRAAFTWVSVQRHATVCPMARSQAFELARQAMLARLSWAEGLNDWANHKFEKDVRPMFTTGLGGQWCREMTATITTYQRMMFE